MAVGFFYDYLMAKHKLRVEKGRRLNRRIHTYML
jgi:hypothetical protein